MNIEDFRAYCLSLKGVTEKMPFGKAASEYDRNLLVFSVLDKWFCFVNVDVFDFCDLKCDPEQIVELQECYEGIRPGYHMNKKHWNTCYFTRLDNKLMRSLIDHSYELVIRKFDRKTKEAYEHIRQEKQ